jgi:TatD DNase family protein
MILDLTDTHCHLTLPEFDSDRQAAIERASDSGISRIVVPGIDLPTSQAAVALAEGGQGLRAAVGIHPHHASEWNPETARRLAELAASPAVCAIGEIGLDYYRGYSPREDQLSAFLGQLDLAAELGLPVVVHNREATQDVLQHLIEWSTRLPEGLGARAGVLHAFSADTDSARRAITAGFFLGVGGPITYHDANARREITAELPVDRLVIETDSPYMTPHPHRGQRNEPALLALVAQSLSDVLGMQLQDLATATSANAARLFGWTNGSEDGQLH